METARSQAVKFAERWRGETYERGVSQTFWNEFFELFGRSRRAVALFERRAKRLDRHGFMDLFWPGKLIVEHKSTGRPLAGALEQAEEYMVNMQDKELPQHVLACDFANFHLIDIERRAEYKFGLESLPDNVGLFGFMTERPLAAADIDPVNQKATMIMGRICDLLLKTKYGLNDGNMERLLTRLVFCLFADDTGIFGHGAFARWLRGTNGDTLCPRLVQLFEILNTKKEDRQAGTDDFPYVDGDLFRNPIPIPVFTDEARDLLVEADKYNWSKISPAIFGSMFQTVLDKKTRRTTGAHYTTEGNIMRVIGPLFLDGLCREFEEAKAGMNRRAALERFQNKLASLKFLDPACGSGNFLAMAYRELRRLELKVILELHDARKQLLNTRGLSKVDVNQFYGIEINKFSAHIAEISLWMTDHLMNRELGSKYGLVYSRIPHKRSPTIICADALKTDWNDALPAGECSYVLGNPPYGGSKVMATAPRALAQKITNLVGAGGTLDYVAAWFFKAAEYSGMLPSMRIGFVATSSVVQGEQAGQMWPGLLDNYGLKIEFAYRAFRWESEASGQAHVYVVIIGLGRGNGRCRLFHSDKDEAWEENPEVISPYLFGTDRARVVRESSQPLNGLPNMSMGSKPIDGGHYIFSDEQREAFLSAEPGAKRYFRPYVDAKGFIHRKRRWILALHDIEPNVLGSLPHTANRVEMVRDYRLASRSPGTRRLAETPTLDLMRNALEKCKVKTRTTLP